MTRSWWAALALLAVFAMHGLATHASAGEPIPVAAPVDTRSAPAAPATPGGPPPAPHPASHPASHLASPETASVASLAAIDGAGHDDEHHAMQVLGLCLAVLASAALAMLRLLGPRRGLVAVEPRADGGSTAPGGATHSHPPPDLHALSILRC